MAKKRFDLVVIGTGSAATTVAQRCAGAGWTVAVVDARPYGGTCALRGCDPKKVLVGAAEVVDLNHRMATRGIVPRTAALRWPALMRLKRSFTDPVPASKEKAFRRVGIATIHGQARFTGPQSVHVGRDVLEARRIVIATGARPAPLGFTGEELVATSDAFLELGRLPRRPVFIGGGFISFEFAHVAARAGARPLILHRGGRPLAGFDPDLVDQLVVASRAAGIEIELGLAVDGVHCAGRGFEVTGHVARKRRRFRADLVVHGAGRIPDLAALDLAAGVVSAGPGGVKVNEFLQSTSNPAVYAAGDAADTDGPPLTPVAGLEGGVVATNLLEGNRARVEEEGVPTVVFSLPPLAAVGLSEQAARRRGLNFRVKHADTSGWYSSRRTGEPVSGFKVLVEEPSDRLLGAHFLGAQAEELVNLFALALRHRLTAGQLKATVFAYPTFASNVAYMV